jgi:hypothetical protein
VLVFQAVAAPVEIHLYQQFFGAGALIAAVQIETTPDIR